MIRMGRSKQEQPTSTAVETPQFQETYASSGGGNAVNSYGGGANQQSYAGAGSSSSSRTGGAVSESESIARDIKEGRLSGFVGHGTMLTGETNFQAMLRVDGHLTGRVASENGTLIVGSNGRVDANIMVAAAAINGEINGDIVALEKVELGRTARVVGNIQTPRLVIEDGAIFEGSCTMLKAKESLEQRIAESKAQIAAANAAAAADESRMSEAVAYVEDEDETMSEAATTN